MIDNFETIKGYIITLGDLEDSEKLTLQIKSLIGECLAYCYREEVPKQMELPLANVIVGELKKRNLIGFNGEISSYSEGDLSISLNSSSQSATSLYGGLLEPFKRVVGVAKNDI